MKLIINLPFEGFYNSKYSGEIDHCQENDSEHFASEDESKFAPELRLDSDEYSEIFFRVADYSAMYHAVARDYTGAFNAIVGDVLGIELGLEHESMTSPREYNFETDRIFAYIPVATVEKLFAMSATDGHAMLAKAVRDRFTSYDGFISGYANRLDSWLAKPVTDWDHNELGTLLIACHHLSPDYDSEWQWTIFERASDDGFYQAWSNGVDWTKFEEMVAESRADKESELREEDGDYVAPPKRCEFTLDLFHGEG